MALKNSKQNHFILNGHIHRLISLIKIFQLASNSNSDAIFLFLGVDLYNRISFSDQNSKNDINKKFVSPNVHRESISPEM